jgi:hypothetical protein
VRETQQRWACKKAKRLADGRPFVPAYNRTDYIFFGRTRQLKKFARNHPGAITREESGIVTYRVVR